MPGSGRALLASRHWKCVWFDPIVAVFVHDSYPVAKTHAVDFGARHFRPDPATEPQGLAALLAAAKGVRNYLNFSISRGDVPRPLVWLAEDYARRIVESDPSSIDGWKTLGQVEILREPTSQPVPRFRMPFDPVFDLPLVRATYAFRRAIELAPNDFMALLGLEQVYEARQMDEAELPVLDRIVQLQPINRLQRAHLAQADASRGVIRQRLGSPQAATWKNLGELDQLVTELLNRGRAGTAAETLERAYPPEKAPWEILDRIATLRLHLGEPDKARDLWRRASAVPRAAVRDARLAVTYFARRPARCGTQGLRAGPRRRAFALRGALWAGRPRARRGSRSGYLRECTRSHRLGSRRGGPRGRPRHRLEREPLCSRRGQSRGSALLIGSNCEELLCLRHRSKPGLSCCWRVAEPRSPQIQRNRPCKASAAWCFWAIALPMPGNTSISSRPTCASGNPSFVASS